MNFSIRKINKETDYPILKKWFEDWKWEAWEIDSISPYGYFVEVDGNPVLFTSFYRAVGCNLAQMGITISDKSVSKFILGRAISKGLDYLFQEAQKEGIKGLRYATDQESKIMVDFFIKKGAKLINNNALVAIKVFDDSMNFFYEGN